MTTDIKTNAKTSQAAWEQIETDLREINLTEEVQTGNLKDVTNQAEII